MHAYGSVEAVAVVVQLPTLLQKVELDPVVETRHFPSLDFTCNVEESFDKHIGKTGKAEYCSQTCKDVLEAAGVQLVVVAGVQTEPHHLQVLDEGFL